MAVAVYDSVSKLGVRTVHITSAQHLETLNKTLRVIINPSPSDVSDLLATQEVAQGSEPTLRVSVQLGPGPLKGIWVSYLAMVPKLAKLTIDFGPIVRPLDPDLGAEWPADVSEPICLAVTHLQVEGCVCRGGARWLEKLGLTKSSATRQVSFDYRGDVSWTLPGLTHASLSDLEHDMSMASFETAARALMLANPKLRFRPALTCFPTAFEARS